MKKGISIEMTNDDLRTLDQHGVLKTYIMDESATFEIYDRDFDDKHPGLMIALRVEDSTYWKFNRADNNRYYPLKMHQVELVEKQITVTEWQYVEEVQYA